ncbi:prepilin peptidase [Candidatus Roizmanbacteria bacterium CG09_land_8_20_14_0_10_41_9]|uniref:Prepilin peptidase n=1 Tax=Candidatus Roizmanbacteria bacterium CG09_land_8_20_14_0_10_41_9 TaxID=1974850 RepID=A0A2H0WSW1_9BACT|nr:MAG: prepilin peptidase [Candidatus Roizmanbacteria bacterium CG09_land_8_20_14_0_10_41_9]
MPIIFYIFLFLFGTAIGSFLNVLIDRLPQEESIMGRSRCDSCGHVLGWRDLFPLVSYFFLMGKCRYCNKKVSIQYPLVELATGLLFVFSWVHIQPLGTGLILKKFIILLIVSCFIVIFVSDAKYHLIPDSVQVVLFSLSLFLPFSSEITAGLYLDRIVAAFLVMAPVFFLHMITRGRGMGFGDVKLAFIIGFLLGTLEGLIAIYLAFVLGGLMGIFLILFKLKKLKSRIAFGPFLVAGVLLVLFYKGALVSVMKSMYGL